MYTSMLLCLHRDVFKYAVVFYWNVSNIHIQMMSDYTLIRFIEIK